MRASQQGTPSGGADKCDDLFQEGKTHCNWCHNRFLLLFECTNDGINRIIKKAGSFLTRGYEIKQSVVMA